MGSDLLNACIILDLFVLYTSVLLIFVEKEHCFGKHQSREHVLNQTKGSIKVRVEVRCCRLAPRYSPQ